MNIISTLAGLLLIIAGANGLTEGAASIAQRFHIPPIVIGLTIVAFGTSAPELTVSLTSALKGSDGLAIGNIIGSNLFNTLVIVGFTASTVPIMISRNTLKKEIPLSLLSSIVLFILINDRLLGGETTNTLSRGDGLILLCFLLIFLSYSFSIATGGEVPSGTVKIVPVWKSILWFITGLAGLIWGGDLFVNGASGIARNLGISESVIGLTLVAGGTSLPELATSVVAALKKNPEIAIGNAIGSNLFNIFMVLGCSAAISPMHITGITNTDLVFLIFSGLLLWFFASCFKRHTISRVEGIIMILTYIGYIIYRIIFQ